MVENNRSKLESPDNPAVDRVTFASFTGTKRELLWGLLGADGVSGQELRSRVVSSTGRKIHTPALYPNLDSLVAIGWVEKGSKDGRTNSYSLTDAAREELACIARCQAVTAGMAADSTGDQFVCDCGCEKWTVDRTESGPKLTCAACGCGAELAFVPA